MIWLVFIRWYLKGFFNTTHVSNSKDVCRARKGLWLFFTYQHSSNWSVCLVKYRLSVCFCLYASLYVSIFQSICLYASICIYLPVYRVSISLYMYLSSGLLVSVCLFYLSTLSCLSDSSRSLRCTCLPRRPWSVLICLSIFYILFSSHLLLCYRHSPMPPNFGKLP